jgi:hypothetical protein
VELVGEGWRGGQRKALSTASWPVREAHRPQIHSQPAPKAPAPAAVLEAGALMKDEIA